MPYLMRTHFTDFLDRITVKSDGLKTAAGRCGAIAELLREHFVLLDSFATGSLARGTGVRGSSDADLFAVLHYGRHVEGKTPMQLLQSVRDVLSDYNARIAKKNGQAVTLYFATWPNVDIVPVFPLTSVDAHPLTSFDVDGHEGDGHPVTT